MGMEMDTSTVESGDFFAGFDAGEDTEAAETETTAETEQDTTAGDEAQETAEAAEADDSAEQENAQEEQKDSAEEAAEPEKADSEQMFGITTDGKTESVTLDELKTRAQKGGAFDRVKGQLTEARQTIQQMTEEAEKSKAVMQLLEFASRESGIPVEQLPANFYSAFIRAKGGTQAEADAKLKAFSLEQQLAARQAEKPEKPAEKTEEEQRAERATADFNEFRAVFPDVPLKDALTDGVKADIQKGMSLLNAYTKAQNEKRAAELAEQAKQQKADEKNRKNRRTSPGSQKTSGGAKNTASGFFASFET